MNVGLDIGRRSVKLVRIDAARRSDEAPRSVRGAIRELDPSLEGPAGRAAVVKAIRECAEELQIGKTPVAIAVPRAEAVLKTVLLPPVAAEERMRLIRFQAAKDVPFELSEVVLASGVVGPAPQAKDAPASGAVPTEVNYAAVRTSVLDSLRALVREAGLEPGALEISTQAAARAARLLAPDAPDSVLVLVGALASEIVLLKKGRIAFSRSASVGFAGESGWLERLVAEVQRSLRAASGGPAAAAGALVPSWVDTEDQPAVLLLAGGGVMDPNAAATLAARLGIPARTLEPLGPGSASNFVVARGLADPRPVAGIPMLDFAGLADAHAARSVRQKAMTAGALVLLLLVTAFLVVRNELVATERSGDEFEAEIKKVKPGVDAVKKLLHEVTIARDWEKRKGRSLDVLLAVSKALPTDDAYLTRLQWSEGKTVLLAGRVRDQESFEKYLRRLNRDPLIERATPDHLSSPERVQDAVSKGLDFAVTARLRDVNAGEKTK